jgi:hypothetical protein
MRKIVLMGLMALFAMSSLTAVSFTFASTTAYAKDAPGKCGATNYFDKKKKKCVSAIK